MEVDRQKVVGIVSFLAQVGGIYTISIAIFLFFMLNVMLDSKNFDMKIKDRGKSDATDMHKNTGIR